VVWKVTCSTARHTHEGLVFSESPDTYLIRLHDHALNGSFFAAADETPFLASCRENEETLSVRNQHAGLDLRLLVVPNITVWGAQANMVWRRHVTAVHRGIGRPSDKPSLEGKK
jgi:hypothetical protein